MVLDRFENYVTIGRETKISAGFSKLGYKDITDEIKKSIMESPNFNTIQINGALPSEAFEAIDELLALRSDITFRIFGLYDKNHLDLDVLSTMKNLTHLRLDCIHLSSDSDLVRVEKLCGLKGLKSLALELFDLKDYSFIQDLDKCIEDLSIMADTMKGTPVFDCKWLLEFPKIHTLYLGKKAKKNYKCIAKLPNLKNLALRGIKTDSFDFLKETDLEVLRVLWAGVENFESLGCLKSLKHLELWRIPKLSDIGVIRELENLKSLKLQDLRNVKEFPDVSNLKKFKELILINMPIEAESIPDRIKVNKWG